MGVCYGSAVLVGLALLLVAVKCDVSCKGVDGRPGEAGPTGRDGQTGMKGQKGEPGNIFLLKSNLKRTRRFYNSLIKFVSNKRVHESLHHFVLSDRWLSLNQTVTILDYKDLLKFELKTHIKYILPTYLKFSTQRSIDWRCCLAARNSKLFAGHQNASVALETNR